MKPHTLNQVAIWMPMKADGLDVKTFNEYSFIKKGIIQSASPLNPVIRYAKNYRPEGLRAFSLCLISQEKNTKKMEEFLDHVAETAQPGNQPFELTDIFYNN